MKRLIPAIALALALFCGCHVTPPASPVEPTPHARAGAVFGGYDFSLGQGDSNVVWSRPVFTATGDPQDLTGATIEFRYRIITQISPAVENPGFVSGTTPPREAAYRFTTIDTATTGDFNASFIVTLPTPDGGVDGSATTFTWPTDRFLKLHVSTTP